MKQYNITPDNIRDYMNNYDFDSFLEIDDKAGLDFKDEETRAIPHNPCIYQKKTKTRCVKLEITSFRGISLGAMHYYGKLIADGVDFQCLDNPNTTTSNWDAENISPLYQWSYYFELRRPITQEEIERDPDRWYGYDPEGFTSSFDTKEEIIALAKECFKMRFKGEWELWVEDDTVAKGGVSQITFEDEPKFKVGYTVRNKVSGSVGEIIALPYSEDFDWLTVQTVTRSGVFAKRKWSVANLELVTKH